MNPQPRVLHVGCGKDDYGTDRVDYIPTDATTEVASAESLPYPDETFSEVFSKNLLEHLCNPGLFFAEAHRVLQPNGQMILITDNAGFLGFHIKGKTAGDYHSFINPKGTEEHVALFTRTHLRSLATRHDFKVATCELVSFFPQGIIGRSLHRFLPTLGYPHLLLIATKEN